MEDKTWKIFILVGDLYEHTGTDIDVKVRGYVEDNEGEQRVVSAGNSFENLIDTHPLEVFDYIDKVRSSMTYVEKFGFEDLKERERVISLSESTELTENEKEIEAELLEKEKQIMKEGSNHYPSYFVRGKQDIEEFGIEL